MKETRRLIIDKEQQTLTGRAVVGPETSNLKERFKEGSIPLQTDFEKLIDIADIGRKAVGLAPGQEGSPGVGLQLSSGGNLSVKPGRGMEVTTEGVRIKDEFAFQKGMILMFSGTTVPIGWAVCDGSNGTPNLINRFILGSTLADSAKFYNSAPLTGSGSTKAYDKLSTLVTVEGSVTVNNTTLNETHIPSHNHNGGMSYTATSGFNNGSVNGSTTIWRIDNRDSIVFADQYAKGRSLSYRESTPAKLAITSNTGGGMGHSHSTSMSFSGHRHSTDVIPPYYTLAFIMKL